MSMLSSQCDTLRVAADALEDEGVMPACAKLLRDAADTIWELRNDYVELRDENAKLRELVRDMFEEIESGGFDPMVERHGKSTVYYEEDPSWRVKIRERVRELGIEV